MDVSTIDEPAFNSDFIVAYFLFGSNYTKNGMGEGIVQLQMNNVVMKWLKRTLFFTHLLFFFFGNIVLLYSLTGSQPFVHDEAVYLAKARSWLEGTPSDEFRIYRPIGMPVAGWLILHFSDSEQVVRLFGVVFGALASVFLFLLFRSISNVWIAFCVTLSVSLSSVFLRHSPEFLNDIPSSGLLFGLLWLLWRYYETAGKSRSIYLAVFLSALAFYLRYGIISALVIIAALWLLVLLPPFLRKERVEHFRIWVSLGLYAILLLPHFIEAIVSEGTIYGILVRGGKAAGREYLGDGLVHYIRLLPDRLGGWVLGVFAIAGVISLVSFLVSKQLRQRYLGFFWVGSVGLMSFLVTGLLVHAEVRYIFFSLALLCGVGIAMVYCVISAIHVWFGWVAKSFLLSVILFSVYFGMSYYQEAKFFFERREVNAGRAAYVEVSNAIRQDITSDLECAVWSIAFRPEISWYSKCNTLNVRDEMSFQKNFLIHFRKAHYSVIFSGLEGSQIDQASAEKFGVKLTEIFRTKSSKEVGDVVVYRITEQKFLVE